MRRNFVAVLVALLGLQPASAFIPSKPLFVTVGGIRRICCTAPMFSTPRRYLHPRPTTILLARPKTGSVVDSYQTISVNCSKCRTRLFRYKKKNGTKSNLVKCYVERISEDCAGILATAEEDNEGFCARISEVKELSCPECNQKFARSSLIHGRPALKLVGGKVRMTKK